MTVQTLLLAAVSALALGFCYCLWRAAGLFLGWRPAAASVLDSDYSELQQQDDFWSGGFTLATIRGWNWRDGKNSRYIRERVVFEDAQGVRQHAEVGRQVRRGWRPDAAFVIWYDPRNPERVTAFGPGHWLMSAFVAAVALALVMRLCWQIGAGQLH